MFDLLCTLNKRNKVLFYYWTIEILEKKVLLFFGEWKNRILIIEPKVMRRAARSPQDTNQNFGIKYVSELFIAFSWHNEKVGKGCLKCSRICCISSPLATKLLYIVSFCEDITQLEQKFPGLYLHMIQAPTNFQQHRRSIFKYSCIFLLRCPIFEGSNPVR